MDLITLFHSAESHIHYPRIKFPYKNNYIEISIASKARNNPNFPNYLYIKFMGNYIGKVTRDNQLALIPTIDKELNETIQALHKTPFDTCKIIGQQFSYCCFCGTIIHSKNSLAVGYGPICAANWGLPWEGEGKKLAEQERDQSNKDHL